MVSGTSLETYTQDVLANPDMPGQTQVKLVVSCQSYALSLAQPVCVFLKHIFSNTLRVCFAKQTLTLMPQVLC